MVDYFDLQIHIMILIYYLILPWTCHSHVRTLFRLDGKYSLGLS